MQLFSTNHNYFLQNTTTFDKPQRFSRNDNCFLQSCNYFLQTTTFFKKYKVFSTTCNIYYNLILHVAISQILGLKILDTRPSIVYLLAINGDPRPPVKINLPSNIEFHWSSIYCSEIIVVVNSYLLFSLYKSL